MILNAAGVVSLDALRWCQALGVGRRSAASPSSTCTSPLRASARATVVLPASVPPRKRTCVNASG